MESEWLFVPDSGSPPSLYFNATKLGAWSSTVDYIEVCQFVRLSCWNKKVTLRLFLFSKILLHLAIRLCAVAGCRLQNGDVFSEDSESLGLI